MWPDVFLCGVTGVPSEHRGRGKDPAWEALKKGWRLTWVLSQEQSFTGS